MIRFPIDLRVLLMQSGFQLSPWKAAFVETPKIEPEDPELLRYEFGAVHGLLCFSPESYLTIIAIANAQPGNGDFARAMSNFEDVAVLFGCHLLVTAIWNPLLKVHLIKKRGYEVDPEDEGTAIKRLQGLKWP